MDEKKTAGQKLVEALRKAGFEIITITIVETPENKQRHKDVTKYIKLMNDAHKATKNSKLHFGSFVANPT